MRDGIVKWLQWLEVRPCVPLLEAAPAFIYGEDFVYLFQDGLMLRPILSKTNYFVDIQLEELCVYPVHGLK
jgi:hypothetical protein